MDGINQTGRRRQSALPHISWMPRRVYCNEFLDYAKLCPGDRFHSTDAVVSTIYLNLSFLGVAFGIGCRGFVTLFFLRRDVVC